MKVIAIMSGYNAQQISQGMTYNVRFTFSVCDTTHAVYHKY